MAIITDEIRKGAQAMIKVTAAILIKDGRVLIAKRRANDKLANKWEFPGGKIETGESPEECLRREMREEFQVEITVKEFFGESIYRYDHTTVHLLAYLAHLEKGDLKPTSHAEYRWVSADELDKYDFAPADKPFVEKIQSSRVIE